MKKNKKKLKEYFASYYIKNREKLLSNVKQYKINNEEKVAIYRKELTSSEKYKKERIQYQKIYYANHKEEYKVYAKKYRLENKKKMNLYLVNKRKNDINFKIAYYLRARLRLAIKSNQKSGSAVNDLGCSIKELITYLEKKFLPGMNWKNWTTNGWHIDHKKPLNSFNLVDRKQFLEAVNYTNLQPLWAVDNLKKGSNIL